MKCRTVTDAKGDDFLLTENEEKYLRTIERLSRMDAGRLYLFGIGTLDVRINGVWQNNSIIRGVDMETIHCGDEDGG